MGRDLHFTAQVEEQLYQTNAAAARSINNGILSGIPEAVEATKRFRIFKTFPLSVQDSMLRRMYNELPAFIRKDQQERQLV